jgi:phosphatidylglycerophosphate synthase
MASSSDLVVIRPLLAGAGLVILGSLIAAAPIPAAGAVLGYLAGALLITLGWNRSRLGLSHFGAANLITLGRAVGTGWILALLLQAVWREPTPVIAICIAVVGGICLALDGVDGQVARSRGEASSFGARFDIETDAATALLLTVALLIFGIAGWWVLIIGLLRYGYVAVGLVVRALQQPLPYSQARRVIGVGQAVLLVIALMFDALLGDHRIADWLWLLPAFGLAALVWSFGRDIIGQLRTDPIREA